MTESPRVTGSHNVPMAVSVYSSLAKLPDTFYDVFAEGGRESFYLSRAWFETLCASTVSRQDEIKFYGVSSVDKKYSAGLLAMVEPHRAHIFSPRVLCSLSNFYTMLFAPIFRASADPDLLIASIIGRLAGEKPLWDVVHFRALDRQGPTFNILEKKLEEAGFRVQAYFHFGNWYEDLKKVSVEDYMIRRPKMLTNTIERKEKKLKKLKDMRFSLIKNNEGIEKGVHDYQEVEAQSWKKAEPFPEFMPGLMRSAASYGALRLGIMYIDDRPAAAQVWLVWNGKATIFKLNHVKHFDHYSIGTVLTWRILQDIMREESLDEIDFGAGDQPYKALWMSHRRERWGLIAFNRRTVRGNALAARHIGGSVLKACVKSMRARD